MKLIRVKTHSPNSSLNLFQTLLAYTKREETIKQNNSTHKIQESLLKVK